MNNTPNNQTPTPLRPVRAARRPVDLQAPPQNAAPTASAQPRPAAPTVARPAVRHPQAQTQAVQTPAAQPRPTASTAPSEPLRPTAAVPTAARPTPAPAQPAQQVQPAQAARPNAAAPAAQPTRTPSVQIPVSAQRGVPVRRPAQTVAPANPTEPGTRQMEMAQQASFVDNTATRRLSVTPPVGQRPVAKAPEQKREKKKKKQMSEGAATLLSVVKAISYLVFVIVLAGFLAYALIQVTNDMFAFVKSDEQVTVVIPENATIYDVSESLAGAGIIAYPDIFEVYAKIKKDNGLFVAGEYEINAMMNYDELLLAFKEVKVRGTLWLTIPEGFTVDEIIDLFVENGIGGTREDWVEAVNNRELYTDFEFVRALLGSTADDRTYLLEGYLFPDTYEFYTDAKASQIVYKLLNRFNNVFRDEFYTRADELGFTVDEIIILASMIEKETRRYNEFEQVASVFHNRLRDPANYPYLDSDATVMYAIHHDSGERKDKMEATDKTYASPYNTYANRGLPPGPIANPSYQAITCALYPENTDFFYFVSRQNGETIFSKTYPEHQAAVAMVARENAEE